MRIKYVDLQKCYSVKLGEAPPVVLRPAASQDRCQGAMQGLEELRSSRKMLVRLAEKLGPGEPVRFDVAAPHSRRAQ